jgi:hypothetical protein
MTMAPGCLDNERRNGMSRVTRSRVSVSTRPFAKAIVVMTVLASGCASLPPVQVAKDLNQIVGKWEGYTGDGTRLTMTIGENGRYRAVNASGREVVGQVQVSEGRFRFKGETTGLSGTMTLYEGEGRRILRTRTDDASITAEYTPGRP